MLLFLTLPLDDCGKVAHDQRMAHIDKGPGPPVPLVHHIAVLEVVHQCNGTLDSCVSQRADLLAVEHLPSLAVELVVEVGNELGMQEIDESVSHVTGILL